MKLLKCMLLLAAVAGSVNAQAELPIEYSATALTNQGSGDFAPYYISSNTHGKITQAHSELIEVGFRHAMDSTQRISYGFGLSAVGGMTSKVGYQRYLVADPTIMNVHKEGPSAIWLQQLYGDVKYRSIFMTLGQKEWGSKMLDDRLSSGDLSRSANSRPMPGVEVGFIDYQDIPFTNGWLQIEGVIGYYKQTDGSWLEGRYNYRNDFVTTGAWFNYKRCYFRTNPTKRFVATIGLQASVQFGGTASYYNLGVLEKQENMPASAKSFFRCLVPGSGGGSGFVEGNHLGSLDVMGEYRLNDGSKIKAYYQNPWEDGSSLGKLNGFDGLYGLEYKASKPGLVSGAVLEYFDFTNQSGPMHWAPGDFEGTTITSEATGADDYYNNYAYNGYAYYGMSVGTPLMKSTLYNTDGYMRYTDNRIRGFHAGVDGLLSNEWGYRMLLSYRKSWGTPMVPSIEKRHDTSFMLEGRYVPTKVSGLSVKGQVAFDRGNLYGNTFGVLVGITYNGLFKL